MLETAFFGESDPEWVDAAAQGDVAYLYDGEAHWNAVWSYVFWNRKIRNGLRARGRAARAGPHPAATGRAVPARRARRGLAQVGRRRNADVHVPGRASRDDHPGRPRADTGSRCGGARARSDCRRARVGVQGSGDIYGPASMIAYGCRGGTFELTLIAKGSPVTVRLDNGQSIAGAGDGPPRRSGVRRFPPSARRASARSRSRRAASSARRGSSTSRAFSGRDCATGPRARGRRARARRTRCPSSTTRPRSIPRLNAASACSSESSPREDGHDGERKHALADGARVPLAARDVGDHSKREQADRTPPPSTTGYASCRSVQTTPSISSPIVCPGAIAVGAGIIRSRTRRPENARCTCA